MAVLAKGAGDVSVYHDSPASGVIHAQSGHEHDTAPSRQPACVQNGAVRAAPLSRLSRTQPQYVGSNISANSSQHQFCILDGMRPEEHTHVQSARNRKRREHHQRRQQERRVEERRQKRRFLWNRVQREERVAQRVRVNLQLMPPATVQPQHGLIKVGLINMEKSNQEKLESLVHLAASRGWEVTAVPEASPTTFRRANDAAPQSCRFWYYEGWTFVSTGLVGILLDPAWSEAWSAFRFPKHRAESGRVLSIVLPRDPMARPGEQAPAFLVTAAWAPVSSVQDMAPLEVFWDEVNAAALRQMEIKPQSALTSHFTDYTPHMILGDFNAQVFEHPPVDDHDASNVVVGNHRPPHWHQLDEVVFDKIAGIGGWVNADSFRAALGVRHRTTWYSSIHKKSYEIDWMMLRRRHLNGLISMTVRHDTVDLVTQHSAKEYVFRLEQTARTRRFTVAAKPDLLALRGVSEAAREAQQTLATKVSERVSRMLVQPGDCLPYASFRQVVAQATMDVCGPQQRSSRKPWLVGQTANRLIAPTVSRLLALRRARRDLQLELQLAPDDVTLQNDLLDTRNEHRDVKTQQRRIQKQLEQEYWNTILDSHPKQESDCFQFHRTFGSLRDRDAPAKRAKTNPRSPEDWRDHFSRVSVEPEHMDPEVRAYIDAMEVSDAVRQHSASLDNDITDDEINSAIRHLRPGAGGGDQVPPVVLKALFRDEALADMIRSYVRQLWTSPCDQWQLLGLDGPGEQVPLWKQKEPFEDMDKWRVWFCFGSFREYWLASSIPEARLGLNPVLCL
ncbi:unnamed protein product [Polarella glacialis]|uniref:Endonuclease/exonuclease/phosphatase domain-containing protein n=1 Tax=Polarella glacialis TaxID=89957 RepID=A0A813JVU6_POLGL|nr:unnamed protein product [Polarella glacialis]